MFLTISEHISKLSAQDFFALVKSYYKTESTVTQAKSMSRISITTTKRGHTVRLDGDKTVTEEELAKLSIEYSIELVELVKIFQKRKIKMLSASGEAIHEPVRRTRVKKAKKNAQCEEVSEQVVC